jgi:hypothetical protein
VISFDGVVSLGGLHYSRYALSSDLGITPGCGGHTRERRKKVKLDMRGHVILVLMAAMGNPFLIQS